MSRSTVGNTQYRENIMIKPIAAVLIVALLVVGIVASTFIASGVSVDFESNVKVKVGVDHKPSPTYNFHVKREKTWGAT